MTINYHPILENLIQSVPLIAGDYVTQISALPAFVHIPDEIALTYHDSWLMITQLQEAGLLTADQVRGLNHLEDLFEDLNLDKSNWTLDALETSPKWQLLRIEATDVLALFARPKQAPNLDWIVYVRSNS